MSKTLANCAIWLDDVQIDSDVNQVAIQAMAANVDTSVFALPGVARLSGLKDGVISVSGFWEALPDPDLSLFGDVGLLVPVTVAIPATPGGAAAGNPAYTMLAEIASYGPNGKIGGAFGFSLKAAAAGRLAQGILAEFRTATVTGNGSIYGPLAVPSSALAKMVASLHVTAMSGSAAPTLTVTLQSAAAVGFGSPTTRASFTAATGLTSQTIEVPGPITDQYWRFIWTISGTTPSFTFAAALGLAP